MRPDTHLEALASASPPCRVCKSAENVIVWSDEHPERTICWECCATAEHHDGETGHNFTYDRRQFGGEWSCDYCGVERGPHNYDYQED